MSPMRKWEKHMKLVLKAVLKCSRLQKSFLTSMDSFPLHKTLIEISIINFCVGSANYSL